MPEAMGAASSEAIRVTGGHREPPSRAPVPRALTCLAVRGAATTPPEGPLGRPTRTVCHQARGSVWAKHGGSSLRRPAVGVQGYEV